MAFTSSVNKKIKKSSRWAIIFSISSSFLFSLTLPWLSSRSIRYFSFRNLLAWLWGRISLLKAAFPIPKLKGSCFSPFWKQPVYFICSGKSLKSDFGSCSSCPWSMRDFTSEIWNASSHQIRNHCYSEFLNVPAFVALRMVLMTFEADSSSRITWTTRVFMIRLYVAIDFPLS